MDKKVYTCETCKTLACRLDLSEKYPDFCLTKKLDKKEIDALIDSYRSDEELLKIMQVSSAVEGQNYLKMTRLEETIDFIKRMDYKIVGIASCISLLPEAAIFSKILEEHGIESRVVSCKIAAIDKSEMDIGDEDRIRPWNKHESMCNPIMQAKYLNKEVEFAIVMGLCVGHDTIFYMHSEIPTTTFVVKDRVTCHNPIAPLHYTDGIYNKVRGDK